MNSLVFVIIIVAIGCATAVVTEYLKTRRHSDSSSADVDRTLRQIEALEERVRVLERIVTEKNFDLKKEIDSL